MRFFLTTHFKILCFRFSLTRDLGRSTSLSRRSTIASTSDRRARFYPFDSIQPFPSRHLKKRNQFIQQNGPCQEVQGCQDLRVDQLQVAARRQEWKGWLRKDMCLSAIVNGLIDFTFVLQYTLGYKQALKNLRNGKGERHF